MKPYQLIIIFLLSISAYAKTETYVGEFRYMADAPSFTDCATSTTYPVAMEKEYITLERAYRKSNTEPGEPLGVTLKGYLDTRPAMEGDGVDTVFIVKKFKGIDSAGHCTPPEPSLTATQWTLIEMNGTAVSLPTDGIQVSLTLSDDGRAEGQDGCNGYGGIYQLKADSLTFDFGGMMSTLMFCEQLNGLDNLYKQTLEKGVYWRIDRGVLLISNELGDVILRFKSNTPQ